MTVTGNVQKSTMRDVESGAGGWDKWLGSLDCLRPRPRPSL